MAQASTRSVLVDCLARRTLAIRNTLETCDTSASDYWEGAEDEVDRIGSLMGIEDEVERQIVKIGRANATEAVECPGT